MTGSSP